MSKAFDPNHARGQGLFGLPHTVYEAGVVIVPIPWEPTACYGTGTAGGPRAVLQASPHLDLLDRETGSPCDAGVAFAPTHDAIASLNEKARALADPVHAAGDAGDTPELTAKAKAVDALSEEMNTLVRSTAQDLLAQGKLVGALGGDHSSPFGLIQAMARHYGTFGLLHIDAHCDLRKAYMGFRYSHASIMFNVMERIPEVTKLVQVGIRDFTQEEAAYLEAHAETIRPFYDADMKRSLMGGAAWDSLADPVIDALPEKVHISFDIDGLDPSLCPHTGTPVPGGLEFDQGVSLIRKVYETGRRIIGFDLNEVCPDPSGTTEWDANVGARIIYKLIGFALLSKPGGSSSRSH